MEIACFYMRRESCMRQAVYDAFVSEFNDTATRNNAKLRAHQCTSLLGFTYTARTIIVLFFRVAV